MSKSNYRRCVGLGVTGKDTSTCFPASIDKLLPNCRVSPEYYRHYETVMRKFDSLPSRQKNPELKKLYGELQDCLDSDELQFERVSVLDELRDVVRYALKEKLGVVIDIDFGEDAHSLGLEVVNRKLGHFVLQSTHVPHALRGVVTLGYIFPNIAQPDEPHRVRYPFNDANVTLVPAYLN